MSESDYPSWHPLSTVSEHRHECGCHPKQRSMEIAETAGAVSYVCADCGGYVD